MTPGTTSTFRNEPSGARDNTDCDQDHSEEEEKYHQKAEASGLLSPENALPDTGRHCDGDGQKTRTNQPALEEKPCWERNIERDCDDGEDKGLRTDTHPDIPLLVLVEPRRDQSNQRLHSGVSFISLRHDINATSRRGGQHHQAHDRAGVDGLAILGDADFGIEGGGEFDEFGRGPGVQPALVDDLDGAVRFAHFSPART